MKICFTSGSVARASFPSTLELTGTLLTCISVMPSRSISSIMMLMIVCCSSLSLGMNTNPVPYFPFSGTGIPCRRINSCGICTIIPAPSPVLLSAPSAPRCFMFSSTLRAESIKSCDFVPCRLTIMPTPQASCSLAGL
ncbi:unknown [Bacteroides sp. CAG:443]|nr:unknown [Bacteroides sp. CAG:443]